MHVIYSARYHIDIGAHVFPTIKYGLVREALAAVAHSNIDFVEPSVAEWDDLALVHTAEYLVKLRTGALSLAEQAQLELPWLPGIVDGFRLMTGGTIVAAADAFEHHRVAAHIGGGFHHAFADHGEGFCLFNDVAVAVAVLRGDRGLGRVAIVDLDVHHGNGTAAIFAGDRDVFTCSMHQEHNYPAWKPPGSLDIGLADGTGDERYLERLAEALPPVMAFEPELLFYLAGADPYEHDQLGGLALTRDGLRRRDRLVLRAAAEANVPVVTLLAGGYARRVDDTVAIHTQTLLDAAEIGAGRPGAQDRF